MAEVVELVPKEAVDKVGETRKPKTGRFRLMAIAKAQREAVVEREPTIPARAAAPQAEEEKPVEQVAPAAATTAGLGSIDQVNEPRAAEQVKPQAEAGDCFEVYEIGEACLVVVWKGDKVDDWGAPILGAACKEILGKKRIRKVVFDFADAREMSTAAVSTLIRFQNTSVHLEKTMCLVARPELRRQLNDSHVDRMIDVVQSVAQVIGTEVRFQERPVVRHQRKPWWKLFSILLIVLLQTANASGENDFPPLAELEKLLPEAPELQAILLEIEKLRLATSWTPHVNFHTSYSQHFASYVPVLSPSDRKISGDSLVLGVSASIALGELVQGRKKDRLELRLKQVEYQRAYQAKLAALRVLYGNRDRLGEHMKSLEAQTKTAGLKLERVRAGMQFDFLGFTAIDLAEVEEAVARLEVERRQTEIEIESIESRILEIVGKGTSGP